MDSALIPTHRVQRSLPMRRNICWSLVNSCKIRPLRNKEPEVMVEMFWIPLRSRKQPWLLLTITHCRSVPVGDCSNEGTAFTAVDNDNAV